MSAATTTLFKGTGVAIVTPFRSDDSIDFKALTKLINFLIENKVDYIVALGTTGESVTLSSDEKHAVIDAVIEVVNKRVPVVVGIGGNNTRDIINKMKSFDYTDCVDGILSVSPYYNKPSQLGIYEHFKAIALSSSLPLIIYNVPGRTGSNICADTTVKLANDFKNIVAVKEASGSMQQIMDIINNKPKDFLVISGDDALAFPIICLGGSGVISVVANAFPKEFSEMVNLALDKKIVQARTIQYQLLDIISALFAEGSPSGIKAALEIKKLAKNHLRLPLVPVSQPTYSKLVELIKVFDENNKS
jgi:4-hydroxy-tetrahydrodipicolinate synthase